MISVLVSFSWIRSIDTSAASLWMGLHRIGLILKIVGAMIEELAKVDCSERGVGDALRVWFS